MRRVQLEGNKISEDVLRLVSSFVEAAHAQGFQLEWVEGVLEEALANHWLDFRDVMLKYVEIIPAQPTSLP